MFSENLLEAPGHEGSTDSGESVEQYMEKVELYQDEDGRVYVRVLKYKLEFCTTFYTPLPRDLADFLLDQQRKSSVLSPGIQVMPRTVGKWAEKEEKCIDNTKLKNTSVGDGKAEHEKRQ